MTFIIVRELIGGIYFGEHETERRRTARRWPRTILRYSEKRDPTHRPHRLRDRPEAGHARLCSVEKSNVLDSSRLWKKVMHELAEEYPDVALTDMLVDNCAMQIVKDPSQFDVIVTENMFGDILSDEASMITGSIGMIPVVLAWAATTVRPVRAHPRLRPGYCRAGTLRTPSAPFWPPP